MKQVKWWLIGGVVLFLVGGAMALLAIQQHNPKLASSSSIVMAGAAVCFGFAVWREVRRVDWSRIEAEQKLWESGPLGRTWLRIRKRLPGQ